MIIFNLFLGYRIKNSEEFAKYVLPVDRTPTISEASFQKFCSDLLIGKIKPKNKTNQKLSMIFKVQSIVLVALGIFGLIVFI